jgi:hypothetical protein
MSKVRNIRFFRTRVPIFLGSAAVLLVGLGVGIASPATAAGPGSVVRGAPAVHATSNVKAPDGRYEWCDNAGSGWEDYGTLTLTELYGPGGGLIDAGTWTVSDFPAHGGTYTAFNAGKVVAMADNQSGKMWYATITKAGLSSMAKPGYGVDAVNGTTEEWYAVLGGTSSNC